MVSFDMSNEVFQNIKPTVTVWNESVALFLYYVEKGTFCWIKELVIGPLVDIVSPLTF